MIQAMKLVMRLFLVLAEDDKTVEEVLPLADRLFHDECRMASDGQIMNKPRIMADMESLVNNKVTMELSRVEEDEFGIVYEYSVRQPREKPEKKLAKAMVRDGKIYHVEICNANAVEGLHDARLRRISAPVIPGF